MARKLRINTCLIGKLMSTFFSLESSQWRKTSLDARSMVNTLPSNFSPEGIGGGNFHDWIPHCEAWEFQGYDENGFPRSLDGTLMDAYEVLNSSASASASAQASRVAGITCKEQQDFYVKHNDGYMVPTHSKIGQEMSLHFEKLLDEHGKNELIPVSLKNDTPNFYLNRDVNSEETYNVRGTDQHFEKKSTVGKRCVCQSNNNSESRCSTHWR